MTAPPESNIQTFYKHWLNAATTLLVSQWKLFEAQYETGLKIVESALGAPTRYRGVKKTVPPPAPQGDPREEARRLEQLAAERVSQGLAPPKEIYKAPYRDQINWAKFPEWAKPTDPEMFEGSGHEG